VREILGEFLTEMDQHLELLRSDVAAQELTAVRRRAHTIKGASGNVGAVALQQLAQQMEHNPVGPAEIALMAGALARLRATLHAEGLCAS